jgi:hypothetical protein
VPRTRARAAAAATTAAAAAAAATAAAAAAGTGDGPHTSQWDVADALRLLALHAPLLTLPLLKLEDQVLVKDRLFIFPTGVREVVAFPLDEELTHTPLASHPPKAVLDQ